MVGINLKDRSKGIVFLIMVVLIWIVASNVMESVERDYDSPITIVWMDTSLFMLYLIEPLYRFIKYRMAKTNINGDDMLAEDLLETNLLEANSLQKSHYEIFFISLKITPFWFIGNVCYNIA